MIFTIICFFLPRAFLKKAIYKHSLFIMQTVSFGTLGDKCDLQASSCHMSCATAWRFVIQASKIVTSYPHAKLATYLHVIITVSWSSNCSLRGSNGGNNCEGVFYLLLFGFARLFVGSTAGIKLASPPSSLRLDTVMDTVTHDITIFPLFLVRVITSNCTPFYHAFNTAIFLRYPAFCTLWC